MAYFKHEAILKQGIEVWNQWRSDNPRIMPDLSDLVLSGTNIRGGNFSNVILNGSDFNSTDLRGTKLDGANLSDADLRDVNLSNANLRSVDLRGSDLRGARLNLANLREANLRDTDLSSTDLTSADLHGADLRQANISGSSLNHADLRYANLDDSNLTGTQLIGADLRDASLVGANLSDADLREANLSGADLRNADLQGSILIKANLEQTDISGSRIYGITAWNLNVSSTTQTDLIITDKGEPEIAVDRLEMAQLVHLLLNNPKLRLMIDGLTIQSVLIMGRFRAERKAMLDGIREALRSRGYVPMVLDFDQPGDRDLRETVITLAGLARFVIADLSDPNSIAYNLVPFADRLPPVPVQGIFCSTETRVPQYLILDHLQRLPHVLPIYRYETIAGLMAVLEDKVIQPAEDKVKVIPPKNRLA